MVTNTPQHISVPNTHIISLCFTQGYFPDTLTIGKVLTIFKSGDKGQGDNYTPVCVLASLGKRLEKAKAKRLTDFLHSFSLPSNNQFSFHKKIIDTDSNTKTH